MNNQQKATNKNILLIILGVLIIPLVLMFAIIPVLISPYIVFPVINDIKAKTLEKELSDIRLPENTSLVQTFSYVGNTAGTGNDTRILVAMLIKSELETNEINEYFGDLGFHVVSKVDQEGNIPRFLGAPRIRFSALDDLSDYEGYYVAERIVCVGAWGNHFDLRGN